MSDDGSLAAIDAARVDGLVPVAVVAELARSLAASVAWSDGSRGDPSPVEVLGSGSHRRLRLVRPHRLAAFGGAVSLSDPVGGGSFLRASSPGASTRSCSRGAPSTVVAELVGVVAERLTVAAWSRVTPAPSDALDRVLRALDADPRPSSSLLSDGEEPSAEEVAYLDLVLSGAPGEWAARHLRLTHLRGAVAAVGR